MEQITILVDNKEHVNLLSGLLNALDFVKSIQIDTVEIDSEEQDSEDDFFALAGIWKDREVDLATIRAKAWPRQ